MKLWLTKMEDPECWDAILRVGNSLQIFINVPNVWKWATSKEYRSQFYPVADQESEYYNCSFVMFQVIVGEFEYSHNYW
jgi:hypothetical protein